MIRPNRLRWLLSASLALALTPSLALAQQNNPPPPAAEEAEDDDDGSSMDEIVVLASPGDSVRIDRRTYTLRDDAAAQSTNMYDVLGRIPSVSVSPAGEVTLLGASNVVIQIDGQPVPGANLEQVLRGLPGGSVERIEVITNPSAQYSAQASGGIINIITRNRFESGFNGSLQASADSVGGYHLGVAPSWAGRRWSFSGQLGTFGGENENNLTRERELLPSGDLQDEIGAFGFDYEGWYLGRLRASLRQTERRRLSLTFDGGEFSGEQNQRLSRSDASGPLSETSVAGDQSNRYNNLTFQLQQDGEQAREVLKFEIALRDNRSEYENRQLFTPTAPGLASAYNTSGDTDTRSAEIKLDFERPLPDERFLTLGGSLDLGDEAIRHRLTPVFGATPLAYDETHEGEEQTLAAYVTYQFDTGDWTWLPGVRAENYSYEIQTSSLAVEDDDLRFFPSLHIRRALTSRINVDLSYTSRIRRPDLSQLNPTIRFSDVNRASTGNPDLEPTTTDAFEANFIYQNSGTNFSVTLFNRISEDVVSFFTETTPEDIILSRPVNAGESNELGLQAMLRGPLGRHWRYSLSGNARDREFDVLSGGVIIRRNEFEYDGVLQLTYADTDQNAVGADQMQVDLRFQGPRYQLQGESEAFVMANLTWRRKVADRLYGVFSVQDIFDSTDRISETRTDSFIERVEFAGQGTRFRLGLTYQFGSGPQRPPPDQGPPMGGGPM